jgi:hypothetical protein
MSPYLNYDKSHDKTSKSTLPSMILTKILLGQETATHDQRGEGAHTLTMKFCVLFKSHVCSLPVVQNSPLVLQM